mgnify:CR=1 FL=1
MENPFDNLRKKREAAALLKQQGEETKRQAGKRRRRKMNVCFNRLAPSIPPWSSMSWNSFERHCILGIKR